jgi:hypothetical protein
MAKIDFGFCRWVKGSISYFDREGAIIGISIFLSSFLFLDCSVCKKTAGAGFRLFFITPLDSLS